MLCTGIADPGFSRSARSWSATSGSSLGQDVTSATAGTFSTYQTLTLVGDVSSNVIQFDTELVYVGVSNCALAVTRTDAVINIGIDASGGTSFTTIIPKLLAGWSDVDTAGTGGIRWHVFPLRIPAGSKIGAQASSIEATPRSVRVHFAAFGGGLGLSWVGQGVEAFGVTVDNTPLATGTSIAPGASGSWGSFTSVGSVTTRQIRAVSLAAQGTMTDTVMAAKNYSLDLGVGGASILRGPKPWVFTKNNETLSQLGFPFPLFVDVAVGTQLQIAALCDATGQESLDCAVYGVY